MEKPNIAELEKTMKKDYVNVVNRVLAAARTDDLTMSDFYDLMYDAVCRKFIMDTILKKIENYSAPEQMFMIDMLNEDDCLYDLHLKFDESYHLSDMFEDFADDELFELEAVLNEELD